MGISREQGNGRVGTMIRHLRFVFELIMLSVFVAGVALILIINTPDFAKIAIHMRQEKSIERK